jgi:2,4-dienoyl-CoA reductase (NADPH2)
MGRRVAVVGGALEGIEAAEFLVKRGRRVTILEKSETIGEGMPPRFLSRLLVWLGERNVQVLTSVREYREITEAGIVIVDPDGLVLTIEADMVVVTPRQRANTVLFEALRAVVADIHLVGPTDEAKPWMIVDAIAKGHQAGCAV